MKKLKLDFQHLGAAEILTRSQLKKIMGGDGGSGGDGTCNVYCPGRLIDCSSDHMDCDTEKDAAGFVIKIACDGTWLTC